MKLTHNGGQLFVFQCEKHERYPAKEAGFWFHGGNCRQDCFGCKHQAPKWSWWTYKADVAIKLRQFADVGATVALQEYEDRLASSAAANCGVESIGDSELSVPLPEGVHLFPFQTAGVQYIKDTVAKGQSTGVLLADEMGLGKTPQALAACNVLKAKNILVVCPAHLRINWVREAKKWLTGSYQYQIVDSKPSKKRGAVLDWTQAPTPQSDHNFVVVNYDRLGKKAVFDALMARQWDVLVADECHMAKNRQAARTKKLLGGWNKAKQERILGLVDRATFKLFLTGTPLPNGRPKEVHSLLAAISPVFRNWKTFSNRYCDPHHNGFGWSYNGASNLDELQRKMREHVMVRRLKADVLKELPAKFWQTQFVAAEGFEDQLSREVSLYDEWQETKSIKTLGELSKLRRELAVAKAPAVVEHLKTLLEESVEKVVVFAHHHEVVDFIMNEMAPYGAVKIDGSTSAASRQDAVDLFQNGDARVFIGSITACATGITLTAAHHVVFAEQTWIPGDMEQASDRCHRIGQENTVIAQNLAFDGSVDARIAIALATKAENITKASDHVTMPTQMEIKPSTPSSERKQAITECNEETGATVTYEQKLAIHAVLRILAGVCDGALRNDDCGFNRMDTAFGHSLAQQETLSDRQALSAMKMVRKYKRQIPEELFERF